MGRWPCILRLVFMASNRAKSEEGAVYLDELTFSAAWKLLQTRGLKNVTVLDAIKSVQRLGLWLLKLKGVQVVEGAFFAGHLKTEEGESVYMAARRLSRQLALSAAREIVESEPQLHRLNEAYGRNTIRLFIAKQLRAHIEYFTARALVAQALCETGRALIWLKKPTRFKGELLSEALPGIDLCFYSTAGFWPVNLARSWIFDVARYIKLTFGLGRNRRLVEPARTNKPSVLMLQEDTIRADRSLRGQPHWLDVSKPPELFDTYVVELQLAKNSITENEAQLSNSGVTILSTSAFRSAMQAMRNDITLQRVRGDRRKAIRAVFQANGIANKFFLLRVAYLLRQAELMGALALWLNSRIFLIRETHHSLADAMQLVAPELNVTTLAYQYSNMGDLSPTMMLTSDKFLIFSAMYNVLYQTDGIAPQEFLTTGYLYDGVACLVREKARRHREVLIRAGAKFIVCYFDESVQHDRWGLVSKDDHLAELHVLVKTVLSDPSFGVVVKSQFIRNSPSRLYPEDELIKAAKTTGRYIELMEGMDRNDIYPTEAALVADLCISHKFGATAALEAAIAGVRTILLDSYGTKTLWDDIYAKTDIEYTSIESLMATMARYREGSKAEQTLGDWTPILEFFDPYRDGNAVHRLRNLLEQEVLHGEQLNQLSVCDSGKQLVEKSLQ